MPGSLSHQLSCLIYFLMIYSNSDDGSGTSCTTLSYAIKQASTSATPVTITLSVGQINITGPMPVITNSNSMTVTVAGNCSTVGGRGVPGSQLVAGAGAASTAFTLTNNIVLSSVKLTGFSGYAVNITGNNNTLTCNWLGTADGTTASGNGGGIRIAGSDNKLGLAGKPESGNLISGNTGTGLRVENGTGNQAFYNWIGLQSSGTSSLSNSGGAMKIVAGAKLKLNQNNRLHT